MASQLQLPAGYSSVASALNERPHTMLSIFGAVTDAMPPTKTSKDWMMTLSVCDADSVSQLGWRGAKIRFFNPDQSKLPQAQPGDLIIVRTVKKMVFGGNALLVSNFNTSTVVFQMDSIPDTDYAISFANGKSTINCTCSHSERPPSVADQMYAMNFKKGLGPRVQEEVVAVSLPVPTAPRSMLSGPANTASPAPKNLANLAFQDAPRHPTVSEPSRTPAPKVVGPATNPKFALVQDLVHNKFHDVIVEVIKTFPARYNDYIEVYVTDYTVNKQLYDYSQAGDEGRDGDTFNFQPTTKREWPGPWGHRVIMIEMRQPHMHFIQNSVKEGDYVEIRNMRSKLGSTGYLEANLWADSRDHSKLLVAKINPAKLPLGVQLLERRDQYWADKDKPPPKPLSNKQKKSARKTREKEAKAAALRKTMDDRAGMESMASNKHVNSLHQDVPVSSFSSMMAQRGSFKTSEGEDSPTPFINQKRRCRVRAVDFYPPDLAGFARPDLQPDDVSEDGMDIDASGWVWDFFLLIEDAATGTKAPTQTWLHVANDGGQCLFNENAADLRDPKKTKLLNHIRQKLDILWGNLAEIKYSPAKVGRSADGDYWSGRLSNLPFDCCIQEYGQRLDDDDALESGEQYIRLFRMFETTIN